MAKHRLIAINLPQFHPFKENDEWWGKGFTEWTNVTKAKPRFRGHYQPHLPTDTGFYDLRLSEARKMQADMAREAGIYGFCYYHYWFNGHRLMERPVNEIIASGEPDFPFMLCWANENWARNWDGGFNEVLMEQSYSEQDDIDHIRWLCSYVFCDKRYIRINGCPVFSVYRASLFPDLKHTVEIWRKIAKEEYGIDLYLICADFPDEDYNRDPSWYGLDATFDFQPIAVSYHMHPQKPIIKKLSYKIPFVWKQQWFRRHFSTLPDLFSYAKYISILHKLPLGSIKRFPCVSPGFDNSPRRVGKTFYCFPDASPKLYGIWLKDVLKRFIPFSNEENFVFINAWNEWAEGNHLEPDSKWGKGYLEETQKAIREE